MILKQTIGVVICGGQSARMEEDKSWIDYHGQPQWLHLSQKLKPFCSVVVLSGNAQQSFGSKTNVILDKKEFSDHGPIGALLSVWHHFSDKNLLVLACDYPYFNEVDFENLCAQNTLAAFYHEQEDLYEPWLAFYPNSAKQHVERAFEHSIFSIQPVLKKLGCKKLISDSKLSITSVDTPAMRDQAKWYFNSKRKI